MSKVLEPAPIKEVPYFLTPGAAAPPGVAQFLVLTVIVSHTAGPVPTGVLWCSVLPTGDQNSSRTAWYKRYAVMCS